MKLLSMYGIAYQEKQLLSLTSFTTQSKLTHYLNILSTSDVWLVSEAGTPWLSDPWKSMIQLCNEHHISYTILPWANALIPAVVWAWFDTSSFIYLWFLPTKKWRQTKIKEMITSPLPVFFYESVHRMEKLLQELRTVWFTGHITIAREISKLFEQYFTGTLDEALILIKEKKLPIKGEFVIWITNR